MCSRKIHVYDIYRLALQGIEPACHSNHLYRWGCASWAQNSDFLARHVDRYLLVFFLTGSSHRARSPLESASCAPDAESLLAGLTVSRLKTEADERRPAPKENVFSACISVCACSSAANRHLAARLGQCGSSYFFRFVCSTEV